MYNLLKLINTDLFCVGSAFTIRMGLIINSYNFIVIQYFTELRKNDTVFSIFTNIFKWEVIHRICIKAISSFSFNSQMRKE